MHLSEDRLHEFLDQELSSNDSEETRDHLSRCDDCRAKLEEMEKLDHANRARFRALDAESMPDPSALWQKVQLGRSARASQRNKTKKRRWKPAWAAAIVAIMLLGASFYFKPVRVWASEFLSLFRVQQIAVIRIDPANLQRFERDLFGSESEGRMEKLLSDDFQVVKRGELQFVSNANDAAKLAGFGVRFPGYLKSQPQIQVHPAVDASFHVDVSRLRDILRDAGRSDIQIPENLDGQMIRVNLPRTVTSFYGKCPDIRNKDQQEDQDGERLRFPECKVIVQLPSPTVVAPPDLNLAQLGTEMLKLLGFSDEQARAFSESIDWTTTLVLPLPMDLRMDFTEVTIDGVKGYLFYTGKHGHVRIPTYNLLWIRDGIIYSVLGQGTDQEALAIANSM